MCEDVCSVTFPSTTDYKEIRYYKSILLLYFVFVQLDLHKDMFVF